MKSTFIRIGLCLASIACQYSDAQAQGIHFSQYYNAPLLLNPANAALMSENDFRVGANYRDQWAKIPVPYKTFSAFADFQAFRGMEATNWMGIGFGFFNDKAGDGELSLTKFDANIAYHVQLGQTTMISAGINAGYGQRSINYDKLTFNEQWDEQALGFAFTKDNGEQNGTIKATYLTIGAGVNLAFFPNEATYIKFGFAAHNLNRPKETFYKNGNTAANTLGIRPTANIDGLFIVNEGFTLNPSLYFTMQKGAWEGLAGTLAMFTMSKDRDGKSQFILGAFYRWDEAAVGALGLQYNNTRFMLSYDMTVSSLAPEVKGKGAWEIGITHQGMYGSLYSGRRTINCPRF
jgi:type IX secretion system PorP/SprF family membrane protein